MVGIDLSNPNISPSDALTVDPSLRQSESFFSDRKSNLNFGNVTTGYSSSLTSGGGVTGSSKTWTTGFVNFDLSSLPPNAVITQVELVLTPTGEVKSKIRLYASGLQGGVASGEEYQPFSPWDQDRRPLAQAAAEDLQQALADGRFTIGVKSDAYSKFPNFSQVESFNGHDSQNPPELIVSYWLDEAPPSVPQNLVATNVSANRINLSWAGSTDNHVTVGYRIYRNGNLISNADNPLAVDRTVSISNKYCYAVSSYDLVGNESSRSNEECFNTSAPPSAPWQVSVVAKDGKVELTWGEVPSSTGYHVYWSTDVGAVMSGGAKVTNATSPFLHGEITAGETYYYVVTSENSYGESGQDLTVFATPGSRVALPATGQTQCYDHLGGVIDCASTGQDGDVRAGVPWPEPRFEDRGDGTMLDSLPA